MRLHNLIAKWLSEINWSWSDHRLYHEARRICIAIYQHIVYNEYLTIMFGTFNITVQYKGLLPVASISFQGRNDISGPEMLKLHGLTPDPVGYSHHYDPTVKAGVYNDLAAFGMRYGHSQVMDEHW
jgi:hypothetical protein